MTRHHRVSLMIQSLWKINGPHWRHLIDTPAIILNFKNQGLVSRRKCLFFDTKLAAKWARRHVIAQNLFHVTHSCFAGTFGYLDAGFEPRCPQKNLNCARCSLILLHVSVAGAPKIRSSP